MQNNYAVVMATYNRKNGNTPKYLEKSLNSIYEQTCDKWDLILVGDKYEPREEIIEIVNNFEMKLKENNKKNKVILLHNDIVERDYIKDLMKLWMCAGANSMNQGLKYARENNYKYYLHLDDDDSWNPNHIEEIDNIFSKYNNCIFVNTKSTYKSSSRFLPLARDDLKIFENNMLPRPCGMTHSSYSFRLDVVDFYYSTSQKDDDIEAPSDQIMLTKLRDFITANKQYCSIYNPVLTCNHDVEGETRDNV